MVTGLWGRERERERRTFRTRCSNTAPPQRALIIQKVTHFLVLLQEIAFLDLPMMLCRERNRQCYVTRPLEGVTTCYPESLAPSDEPTDMQYLATVQHDTVQRIGGAAVRVEPVIYSE